MSLIRILYGWHEYIVKMGIPFDAVWPGAVLVRLPDGGVVQRSHACNGASACVLCVCWSGM